MSFAKDFLVIVVGCCLPVTALAQAPSLVEGRILDPAGMTIADARISAAPDDGSAAIAAQSGPDGSFSLRLKPGRYYLKVTAAGFREELRALDADAGAMRQAVEITLQLDEVRELVTVTETATYQAAFSSAIKAPIQLIDVPQAISVVTQDLIRDQSAQNMADVVRYIPGITMAQGEGHRDAPVIRGNVTTSDFYVNGVRDDVQYFRDLYNVDRVEAVKGANALTFGRGGGGGVINRATKTANFTPIREVMLQGGSFSNRRFTTDLGHNFGERVAVRLNGLYENSGIFRHDVNVERYGVAPTVTVKAGEATRLRLDYEHFHDGRTVDRGIPSFAGRPAPAHRSTFFGDPQNSYADASVHLGAAAIEHQAGIWNVRNTTTISDYDKFYQNIFPGAVNAAQTLVNISGYNNATARRNLFNQTDVTSMFRTGRVRHTVLMGAEFGRQDTANFRNTAYFNGATSLNVPFASPNVRTTALFRQSASDADNRPLNHVAATFVQDQMELTRHVQLVAGVRYDHFNMDFRNRRSGEFLNRADNMMSPRLGLVFKPVSQLSLYGSYSVAYLPGSGDQFSALTASTQTLKPEKFNNYEVGAKWDVNRRLNLTSAIYRLDRNNTTARDPNNPARVVQTGSQRTSGFELAVNGNLTSRWLIVGGYATQDAFISSPTTAAALGAKVAIVPRHTFSFWNNYRLMPRWSIGLGLNHQSSMFAGIDNAVKLPDFTRADAAMFFTLTEKVRLQANLENLFDTTYYPTAHSNNNILPGSARALRIGLVTRF
ncbi:MAG: TonB-dependent siderophore receptor [Bryobacteraceae bacterium]|nr:TonB-dependent siderophore receptor [Bryobacteraceae bacterium]